MAASSDATGGVVRHVRCPRCRGLLQEPGAPVYQCGGCGATLRAKNRSSDTRGLASSGASPPRTRSGLPPPQSSGDVASTSAPTPDARSSEQHHGPGDVTTSRRRHETNAASRRDLVSARKDVSGGDVASTPPDVIPTSSRRPATETSSPPESAGDLVSASKHVPATEKKEHDHRSSTNREREAYDNSGFRNRQEPAPKSAQAAEPQPPPSRDATAVAAGGKVPSPPRHELQQAEEDLAPLRHKILKTVDELKGDLSQLFSKSPDLNPTTRARPPRLPKQQGTASSRGAVASALPAAGAARAVKKPAASPPRRGLPSRRYRRCRADPCCENAQPRTCHHGCCCRHHGKPECSSCRGHCGRAPSAQEPSAPRKPPGAREAKRRPPPRHHCRPVLKGAPFVICSSCFELVQVPADFAVSTNRLRKLRCGSCSAVLSYSYRDPGRKKRHQDSADQFSTDGSEVHGGDKCYAQNPDPFAPFVDDFGLSNHSTEDEQPLHVSRNTSFDTVDGAKGVGRLHRLMGYGSASELLRRSPDLYETSFDKRTTTPDYDRKGKGVCIDAEDDDDDDSDDDEGSGVVTGSAASRGAVWPLPGMPGKGVPGPGAIRIKS